MAFSSFMMFVIANDREKKNRPTLVSLATDITVNVCLRSRASLEKTTAIVAEKKCSNQRHDDMSI